MKTIVSETIRRLYSILPGRFRKRSVLVVFLLFLNSMLDLLTLGAVIPILPLLLQPNALENNSFLGSISAKVGFQTQESFLIFFLGCAVVFFLIKNVIAVFITRYQAVFSFNLFTYVTTSLLRCFYRQGYLYFRQRSSPNLLRDITSNSVSFSENLVMPLLMFLNEALVLFIMFSAITFYDPKAVILVCVVLVPPFYFFYKGVRSHIATFRETLNKKHAELHRTLFQAIFGFVDVKTTNSEQHFFDLYSKEAKQYGTLMSKISVLNLIPTRLLEVTLIGGAFILVTYMLLFLENNTARVTLLGVFTLAAYRTLPSINRITIALMSIKGHQFTLDVVEQLQTLSWNPEEKLSASDDLSFKNQIRLDSIHFEYPNTKEKALKNISFTIKKGEFLGIVGGSGAGKTTLLNIFLGFLKPTSGSIYVDEQPLREPNLKAWYRLIGYVQQEVYLIEGTLAKNIAFGINPKEIDQKKLRDAAQKASLESVIETLPEGFETEVGEKGSRLSVGQKQRVGIARALYSGAEILVFDEPSSALDLKTEEEIAETIKSLVKEGCTVLMVTHRLTPLRHCDRVIELKRGMIAQKSSYEQLAAHHSH